MLPGLDGWGRISIAMNTVTHFCMQLV